ncbi:MAG: T9SS type A sorting domain-containing protein [Bacteroidetes bacterium]|nr:T9SS type A sorting domain-containing protein [Bacteroidota bacterium]
MKKSLLFITSFCIGIISVSAQIIITTADMPVPTKVIYQSNDTVPTISIGAAGSGQTWNFTTVVEHTKDTSTVMPYSAKPNTVFSTANIVLEQQGVQDFYGYAINTASDMTLLGGAGTIDIGGNLTQINQISTPSETLFNFPTTYNTTFTQNYSTSAKFYLGQTVQGITIDSIHQKSGIQKTFLVDAWGTLTTPLAGGPYDVIRAQEIKITNDTTMAFFFGGWNDIPGGISSDSTTTYTWWANGFGAALATATMDTAGAVDNLQWLTAVPAEPPLSVSTSSVNVSCQGLCNGTATAIPNWGSGPKTYAWSTSPVQDSITAIGLCAGTYTVTITDSLLATATSTVTITNPVQPVITANGTTLSTNYTATGFKWFLNGVFIPNATSSTYTVTQNGNYTIEVSTGGGCLDTSAVFNFNTIGINESILNSGVVIFPNPASNLITIKFDATLLAASAKQDVLIDIQNELGQSIKKAGSKQLANGKNEMIVDIADLPNGIYFIQIKNQNTSVNKKFIKQ